MHGTSRSGLQESTITCYNGKRCVRLHFSPSIFRRKCAHVFWSARRYIDMGISVFRQVTYKMRERWANKLLTIRLTETMFNKRFFFSFLAVPLTLIISCANINEKTKMCQSFIKNGRHFQDGNGMKWTSKKRTRNGITQIANVQCDWIDDFVVIRSTFDQIKTNIYKYIFFAFHSVPFFLIVDLMIWKKWVFMGRC